jgi:rubredoxin
MKNIPTSYFLYGGAAVATAALLVAVVTNSIKASVPSAYDGFARCLSEKGAKMYGAWWCPHCQNQKRLFGNAAKYVDYVECSPGTKKIMSQQCVDAGVEGYPTWIFADGTKASGEQTFEKLSERTSCPLPETTE